MAGCARWGARAGLLAILFGHDVCLQPCVEDACQSSSFEWGVGRGLRVYADAIGSGGDAADPGQSRPCWNHAAVNAQ